MGKIRIEESLGHKIDSMVNEIRLWSNASGRPESIGYIHTGGMGSKGPSGQHEDSRIEPLQEIEATIEGCLSVWREQFFGCKEDYGKKVARIISDYEDHVPAELIALRERMTVRWIRYLVANNNAQRSKVVQKTRKVA